MSDVFCGHVFVGTSPTLNDNSNPWEGLIKWQTKSFHEFPIGTGLFPAIFILGFSS